MDTINQYRQELRDKIIDYAMNAFYKHGIKAVKMDDISSGLHVSKRTVYEIFGDKEELLLAGIRQQKENVRRRMEVYAAEGNHNVIDMLCYFYRIQMEHNGRVGGIFFEEIHRLPRVVKYLRESHDEECTDRMRFFDEGIREGLFKADINYPLVLSVSQLTINEIMHQQLYLQYTMQEIFDNYYMVVIRGICTERGLAQLNANICRE